MTLKYAPLDDPRHGDNGAEPFIIRSKEPRDGRRPAGWREHATSAAALQTMRFPPISYVVPGYIAEGLTILAGRPKLGKSWLALDICIAVAAGRMTSAK